MPYAKTLTPHKLSLITPILTKLESASSLLLTNSDTSVLESIRAALYAWQSINNCQGKLKIKRLGSTQLSIENRQLSLSSTSITIPESNLSEVEQLTLDLIDLKFDSEEILIEHLHQTLPDKQNLFIPIVQEFRRQKQNGAGARGAGAAGASKKRGVDFVNERIKGDSR